ncbi:hypothetical protein DL767_002973 [Monosporascus sp. MG133]|nr:hypothetical protein DL767_002973 [Monosporascus sp. MG133]
MAHTPPPTFYLDWRPTSVSSTIKLTYKPHPLPDSLRLGGTTVLVTGSNMGLGLETAKALVAGGASLVVLGVRSVSRGSEAKRGRHRGGSGGGEPVRVATSRVWPRDHEDWASLVVFAARDLGRRPRRRRPSTPGLKAPRGQRPPRPPATGPTSRSTTSALLPEPLRGAARQRGGGADGDGAGSPDDRRNVLWARVDLTRENVVADAVNPGYCRSALHRADLGAWCLADAVVGHADGVTPLCASGVGLRDAGRTAADSCLCPRVSKVVLSPEGERAQKKLWKETLEFLRRGVEGVDPSEFEDP